MSSCLACGFILYHFAPERKMFFIIFLIFFRSAPANPSGKVKMPKKAVARSAPRYPNFSSQGLIAQK